MNNEEKAEKIAKSFSIGKLSSTPIQCCQESALAMAEWKDKWFSNYLKELIKKYTGSASQNAPIYHELNEIHRELFGELAHTTIPNY